MTEHVPILDAAGWFEQIRTSQQPFHLGYYAMYSSFIGGIVTDPTLMSVPVDDHMVHRGDAVFETLKCVRGNIYNLAAHLVRLQHSLDLLSLALPFPEDELKDVIVQTVRAGENPDCLIRLLVSRGPGSLGVNPYDCPAPQVYVIVAELKPPFMIVHPKGARMSISSIPVKPSFFATIKSCNYLPNVLMKKEAVDAGIDFVVALDDEGHLAEGATENAAMVTTEGQLVFPPTDHILSGTTMARVAELAKSLVADGLLAEVTSRTITSSEMQDAREILVVGTTPNVTAVVEFEGQPVGEGKPGPAFERLSKALEEDILGNSKLHTPVFE